MSLPDEIEEIRKRNQERRQDPYFAELAANDDIDRLIGHLEERLRINVGLIAENAELRRRIDELEHGVREVKA